jgi:hypothetical protein
LIRKIIGSKVIGAGVSVESVLTKGTYRDRSRGVLEALHDEAKVGRRDTALGRTSTGLLSVRHDDCSLGTFDRGYGTIYKS